VRVASESGLGTARVTFSFDTWKEGDVAPSTIELHVKKPEPEEGLGAR
jgi:hypothetical protein